MIADTLYTHPRCRVGKALSHVTVDDAVMTSRVLL